VPPVFKPAIGAFVLGLLGVGYVLFFGRWLLGATKPIPFETYPMPAFFSDGYGAIQPMLTSAFYDRFTPGYLIGFMAALLVLKVIGVCLTVSSGGGGGVIGPALFLGAVVGGLLGSVLRLLGANLRPELYALVGMAAVLSAVVHAPLASILILVELTQDYQLILPGMLAAVVSVGVARALFRESIYTLVLKERGIPVGESTDLRLLRRLNVEQVDLDPSTFARVDQSLSHVMDNLDHTGVTDFTVVDEGGEYVGMLVANDLVTTIRNREAAPLLVVADLTRYDIPAVRSSDDLGMVLDRFSVHDIEHLPVTTDRAPGHVIGMISRANLLRRYRQGVQEGR
jgi:CIC family chloride channel protein